MSNWKVGVIGLGEVVTLFGPPGSGKSFLALDLCHHAAAGADWAAKPNAYPN